MFKKLFVLVFFMATVANTSVFAQAQALNIDTAIANAAKEIDAKVPKGSRIAVLNITSDYENLSDYIINELIKELVTKGSFQVVTRSEIELKIAQTEFDFQYDLYVSDDTQTNIGEALGAETIVTGSVTIDYSDNYRLTVNAIHLKSFTYQAIYGTPILNDRQLASFTGSERRAAEKAEAERRVAARQREEKNRVAAGERKETMRRLGTGAANIFFGAGSLALDQGGGFIPLSLDVLGVTFFLGSGLVLLFPPKDADDMIRTLNICGAVSFGAGIVTGFVVPFFYEPGSNRARISQGNFPFDLQLVSSDNRNIDGFRVSYRVSY
ncbi:MAG: hypothetical protein LBG91_00995 [Treponema sp.]|jgi:hypothetical protein|nr:hypothetical protein [Treponema sp.]